MASAFVCHKVSANHQFANGTYFITSALVLKFSAFFDSAVTEFTVTKERSQVMTFAQPILDIYHSLFIKNPEDIMNLNSYVAPLTDMAWMSIAIFVVVGSLCLFIISQ